MELKNIVAQSGTEVDFFVYERNDTTYVCIISDRYTTNDVKDVIDHMATAGVHISQECITWPQYN